MKNVQRTLIEYSAMIGAYVVAMLGLYGLAAVFHMNDHDAKLVLCTILALGAASETRKFVRAIFVFPEAVRMGNAGLVMDELGATPEERARAESAAVRRYGKWPPTSRDIT